MPRRILPILVCMFALLGGACDQADVRADAEIVLGSWKVSRVLLNGNDFSEFMLQQASLAITFRSENAFRLRYIDQSKNTDTQVDGTYQVDDEQDQIVFTAATAQETRRFVGRYTITHDDQIVLVFADATLLELAGLNVSGFQVQRIDLTITRTAKPS